MAGTGAIKPTATLLIGIIPVTLSSCDLAPFFTCLPPDTTPEGRARNTGINKGLFAKLAKPQGHF
jgi:hypothetical protein